MGQGRCTTSLRLPPCTCREGRTLPKGSGLLVAGPSMAPARASLPSLACCPLAAALPFRGADKGSGDDDMDDDDDGVNDSDDDDDDTPPVKASANRPLAAPFFGALVLGTVCVSGAGDVVGFGPVKYACAATLLAILPCPEVGARGGGGYTPVSRGSASWHPGIRSCIFWAGPPPHPFVPASGAQGRLPPDAPEGLASSPAPAQCPCSGPL